MKIAGDSRVEDGRRRLLWIVNHKTLMDAEIDVFRRLGFSAYIPKIVPNDRGYRSAKIEFGYDKDLEIPGYVLRILNEHQFYTERWSPTLEKILNRYFDGLVTSVSGFTTPVLEAIDKFEGRVVARVFGRENPARYTSFFCDRQLDNIAAMGKRFIFGQGFSNLAQIEDGRLASRAVTIPLAIPSLIWGRENVWTGKQPEILLLCPSIVDSPYYAGIYVALKDAFGDMPHVIMGRQNVLPADKAVMPYMSDGELLDLYSRVRVFCYPSQEPRHVHYSPIEAMIVGCPVLYMKGGMLSYLAKRQLPGLCNNIDEMREKARSLLQGDTELANSIRGAQMAIVDTFKTDASVEGWAKALSLSEE